MIKYFLILLALSFPAISAEKLNISIGYIIQTIHLDSDNSTNDYHDGFYIKLNQWSAGRYLNSHSVVSRFVAYDFKPLNNDKIKVNFFIGVADNYKQGMNFDEYIPILGYVAEYKIIRIVITPIGLTFGLFL